MARRGSKAYKRQEDRKRREKLRQKWRKKLAAAGGITVTEEEGPLQRKHSRFMGPKPTQPGYVGKKR